MYTIDVVERRFCKAKLIRIAMPLNKIMMKNTTALSINERFTYLRRNPEQSTTQRVREAAALQQQASVKNRRLAQQMERRPAVMAALKIKRKSLRQRLGQPMEMAAPGGNVRDRLSFTVRNQPGVYRGGRGLARGRTRGRIAGSGAIINRSQGLVILNRNGALGADNTFRSLRRPRGRVLAGNAQLRPIRRGRGASRGQAVLSIGLRGRGIRHLRGATTLQRVGIPKSQIRSQFRGQARGVQLRGQARVQLRGQARGQLRGQVRGQLRGQALGQLRGQARVQLRGRGRGHLRGGRGQIVRGNMQRGRGGARGRRGAQQPTLSKEELDQQLDQYMASTRTHLDQELDSYMTEAWG